MLGLRFSGCGVSHESLIGSEHLGSQGPLSFAQERVPNIQNEDHALAVRIVPGFVFDRIIEDPGFTHSPITRFIADPKARGTGQQEWEMAKKADIR